MEPLVIVSAVVVLCYGYRTVIEIVSEVERDGSWKTVQEGWHHLRRTASSFGSEAQRARFRKIGYYYNFFLEGKREPGVLLKRHA